MLKGFDLRYGFRRFSSTTTNTIRYGFVGLGQMGYPMALNLLRKTSPQSSFTIYDVNPQALSRFVNEAASFLNVPNVRVASSPKDLAAQSVWPQVLLALTSGLHHDNASGIRTRRSGI